MDWMLGLEERPCPWRPWHACHVEKRAMGLVIGMVVNALMSKTPKTEAESRCRDWNVGTWQHGSGQQPDVEIGIKSASAGYNPACRCAWQTRYTWMCL